MIGIIILKFAVRSSLGEHSDRGSISVQNPPDIGSRKINLGHSDRILAQNFGAVLAVVVKLAGDHVFAKFCQDT